MRTVIAAFCVTLFLFTLGVLFGVSSHQHSAENITSKHLMNNTIYIQCEDEHEPVITKLDRIIELEEKLLEAIRDSN